MRCWTVNKGSLKYGHFLQHQAPEMRWIHLKRKHIVLALQCLMNERCGDESRGTPASVSYRKSKPSCQINMAILVRPITNRETERFGTGEVPRLENSSDKWWDLQRLQWGERVGFAALMIQSLSMQITSSHSHNKQNTLCASKQRTVWCSVQKTTGWIRKIQSLSTGIPTEDKSEQWRRLVERIGQKTTKVQKLHHYKGTIRQLPRNPLLKAFDGHDRKQVVHTLLLGVWSAAETEKWSLIRWEFWPHDLNLRFIYCRPRLERKATPWPTD